jgi:mono/diheme cytochrome c family protein
MRPTAVLSFLLAALALAACGGKTDAPASTAARPAGSELTPWQVEHGIGPVTEALPAVASPAHEAEEGKKLYDQRCASCHKANERYVGPPLGGVVGRRTPEYVMNMILAPDQMVMKHPEAKKLLGTYMVQMPNQGLTTEQAREVVEYLRTLPAPPAQ